MDIGDHVRLAVKNSDEGELEAALLHALQAVDGTGKKLRPRAQTRTRIVATIEDYLWVIEPMAGLGFNLEAPLPLLQLAAGRPALFSEVIYEVFRTRLAHGDPFPDGVGIHVSMSPVHRHMRIGVGNQIQLPDTVIWALIAAVVFARVNADQRVGMEGWFRYSTLDGVDDREFEIDQWWGREDEVHTYFDAMRARMIRVTPVPAAPVDGGG